MVGEKYTETPSIIVGLWDVTNWVSEATHWLAFKSGTLHHPEEGCSAVKGKGKLSQQTHCPVSRGRTVYYAIENENGQLWRPRL